MESGHRRAGTQSLTTPLAEAIQPSASVLLDTSTLLYYFNAPSPAGDIAAVVIDDFVRNGRNRGIVSAVSAMEFLVGPIRAGTAQQVQRALEFLRYFPNLTIQSIDLSVATEAAALRARLRLAAPDSLIVASGMVAGASYLVTNDLEWTKQLADLRDRFAVLTLARFARESDNASRRKEPEQRA